MVSTIEEPQKQLGAPNLDEQQERALGLMQTSRNVFLTGMAGTGKSYLVRLLHPTLQNQYLLSLY